MKKLTDDFNHAMKEHIWLDGVTLTNLNDEEYIQFIEYTLQLDHHENLRLYRGTDGDLAPGLATTSHQLDLLIRYLSNLKTKM